MPAAKSGLDAANAARDARRLSTLLEVSQALSGTLNLKASMQRVLGILIRHHGVVRGMVTLLRDGELHVEAAEGFDDRARVGALQGRRRHHRPGGRERQADRRAARQPRAGAAQPRRAPHRAARARSSASSACRSCSTAPPSARSRVDLRFKAERDYDSSVKFFGDRQLDDRAGAQRAARWSRRSGGACSTRTRTCGRSCASATTSRTSSAPAVRRGRCTSRWRRWRRPTPPCSSAASRAPARS